jgi:hypothetical protein
MRELDEEQLVDLPWLPEAVARATYSRLHGTERDTIANS